MRVDGGGSPAKAPTKELGFKKLDVNGDGKLSAEEMKDSKKFQGFDKNNDGGFTLAIGARSVRFVKTDGRYLPAPGLEAPHCGVP